MVWGNPKPQISCDIHKCTALGRLLGCTSCDGGRIMSGGRTSCRCSRCPRFVLLPPLLPSKQRGVGTLWLFNKCCASLIEVIQSSLFSQSVDIMRASQDVGSKARALSGRLSKMLQKSNGLKFGFSAFAIVILLMYRIPFLSLSPSLILILLQLSAHDMSQVLYHPHVQQGRAAHSVPVC
jgi:hypothetical protein